MDFSSKQLLFLCIQHLFAFRTGLVAFYVKFAKHVQEGSGIDTTGDVENLWVVTFVEENSRIMDKNEDELHLKQKRTVL